MSRAYNQGDSERIRVIQVREQVHSCPECGGRLGLGLGDLPEYAICPQCAGISVFEARRRVYRALLTAEWVDIVMLPAGFDLLEARQHLVERLTRPKSETTRAPAAKRAR